MQSKKVFSEDSSVGCILRTRREKIGLEIEDIASSLRIRPNILILLEEDAYGKLPGRAYTLGFIKSYARYLDLDAEELSGRLDKNLLEKADESKKVQYSLPHRGDEGGLSVIVLVGIGLLCVISAYACWYHFVRHVPLSHIAPVSHTASNIETSSPPQIQDKNSIDGEEKKLANDNAGVQNNNTNQVSDDAPSSSQAESNSSSEENIFYGKEADKENSSPFVKPKMPEDQQTKTSSSQTPSVQDHIITVLITKNSWVQIKDGKGKIVQSGLMKEGEKWQGRDEDGPYRMTTGNAGGVIVQTGGVTSAPLGKNGVVRHGITLNVQDIINGHYGKSETPSGSSFKEENNR